MTRPVVILAALGGVAGALGVALAATAAHRVAEPALVTASNMLMVHAAAIIAMAAYANRLASSRFAVSAGFAMLLGIALFAGDIAASKLLGAGLFAFAAPLGGSLLIASWAAFALAALFSARSD